MYRVLLTLWRAIYWSPPVWVGAFLGRVSGSHCGNVSRDSKNYFATITAKPLASLDRLRYLLLLWPTNEDMRKAQSITPEEVRKVVQQRLESQAAATLNSSAANKITKSKVEEHEEPLPAEELPPKYRKYNCRSRLIRNSGHIGRKINARVTLQILIIICIFIIAMVLEIAPWPAAGLQSFKPAWLNADTHVLGTLHSNQSQHWIHAFILGVIWDLVLGSILGVHALVLSVFAYLIAINHLILRNMSYGCKVS